MGDPTRSWRVLNIEMRLDEDESVLRRRASETAGVDPEALRGFRIARRSVDARRRANAVWKAALAEYEPPPVADDVLEALADFVGRRSAAGGAPPD